jgi:hypothetical protein
MEVCMTSSTIARIPTRATLPSRTRAAWPTARKKEGEDTLNRGHRTVRCGFET